MTSAGRRGPGRGRDGKTVRRTGPTTLRAVPAYSAERASLAESASPAELAPPAEPAECLCPGCTGADVDPGQLVDELVDGVAELADHEHALDAELAGAALLTMLTLIEGDETAAFVQGIIGRVEARSGAGALALLLAVGSVAAGEQEEVARAASAAARRLVAAGVPEPRWAGELAQPPQLGDCVRLHDDQAMTSILVTSFQRAGHGHAFVITVDEQDCGACADIFVLDADELPGALDDIREGARADGIHLTTQALDPAEFRWYVEGALEARAEHDEEDAEDPDAEDPDAAIDDEDGEDGPPYPVLAQLVRARLALLPAARQPAGAPDRAHDDAYEVEVPETFAGFLAPGGGLRGGFGGGPGGFGGGPVGFGGGPGRRPAPAKLPAKRKKKDGPAPTYQLKVGLQGAKPPIWRRLLVPADVSLARLHDVIQTAFGWHGGHLHVFETPLGDFGRPNQELGYRADSKATLEQVAAQANDKIQYRYDFGDDWLHEIVVEKVLDPDPTLSSARCTGGRRAAPPDDCGGVWGYGELLEILADPRHPEHRERLEWLGLDDARRFDPAAFDPDEVNRALAKLS